MHLFFTHASKFVLRFLEPSAESLELERKMDILGEDIRKYLSLTNVL